MVKKHNWKSFESYNKARAWVNQEVASKTSGRTFSSVALKKVYRDAWKKAKMKDKKGEFGN